MAGFSPPDEAVLDRLKAIVGADGWRAPDEAARYFDDPRGRFEGRACLVLLPKSTDEVARIVRLCNETGTGLIPWGGGTGVVAGQLSPDSDNAIILSVERLNRVREINAQDFAMVVEAGCILENVHAAAAEHGLMFPLSMASKGSCTIGGNLATNAGGIQVLRHGNARDLCLGIEAVLPSGEVLSELSPLRKNNTGYDLRHLLIGSEGTLGIITAATLVLKPMDPDCVTALCALASPAEALTLFSELRRRLGDSLSGLELMSGFGLDLVTRHFPSLRNPFSDPHDWFLLAEISGPEGMRERVEVALADCLESALLADVVIATSETQRDQPVGPAREHAGRQPRGRARSAIPTPRCRSAGSRGSFARPGPRSLATHPGLRINSYGHIGDGNIHHNVFPPEGVAKAAFVTEHPGIIEAVRDAIDRVTMDFGGAISAEHGIGRLKVADLVRYGAPRSLRRSARSRRPWIPTGS